ncbi:mannose-1-phosphate guanylyltransferase [Aegicerativicinus sediminis]|uniref:mannose-1-phosphate guanylyltransferase n=1 Tax=Aegicerativicinus sediminis TaxID=2893202 RepID=UPI001E320278|nr:mannose-1-phosphate guanylyltransferase [Aegicerativicinus sediminis]
MNKNYYAILMAGGIGSRFWPVSTQEFPKQFHDMFGSGETLIQKTFSRLSQIIPVENILILTNHKYKGLVMEQLPNISEEQVLLEPEMRNTAPCILYAALKIQKQNKEALILVAPSDHWIEDENSFSEDVRRSFDFCSGNDALMTLGIKPTFPNTGYGYIEYETNTDERIKKVKQFREKPDVATAQHFISQGNFLWNAGIFIWSATSVIKAFENNQPELFNLFQSGYQAYNTFDENHFIEENYGKAENISVDYAIMEQSTNVFVLPASFDWNDLGTWVSLYEKMPKDENGNAKVNCHSVLDASKGNMIRTAKGKVVVLEGISDYIIVDKDDVLLIFPKNKEQEIKQLRSRVGSEFGDHYI